MWVLVGKEIRAIRAGFNIFLNLISYILERALMDGKISVITERHLEMVMEDMVKMITF